MSRLTNLTQDLGGTTWDQTRTFAYDPAGRIIQRTASNEAVYAWTGAVSVNRGYTTNGLNQYTASGSIAPTYDARGNTTSTGSTSYTYNASNQLVDTGGSCGWYYYNPAAQLDLSCPDGLYIDHSGRNIDREYSTSTGGPLRRYVYGPGSDEPLVWYEGTGTSDKRWLHADERGSIVAVSKADGTALGINTYDEYGIPGTSNIGRFQYTGQAWLPSLGMYDYKARIYSATLGRFMQTDPIGYGDGMNWYNYVGSDPVNGSDPGGMACRPAAVYQSSEGPVPTNRQVCDGGSDGDLSLGFYSYPYPGDGLDQELRAFNLEEHGREGDCLAQGGSYAGGAFQGGAGTCNIPQSDTDAAAAETGSCDHCASTGEEIVVTANSPIAPLVLALAIPEIEGPVLIAEEGGGILAAIGEFFGRLLGGRACFAAGTLVQTDHGLRAIETIRPGDMVLSRDEKTGRTAYKRVTAVKTPTQDDLYTVEVDVPAGQEAEHHAEFRVTATHPWRTTDGHWVKTDLLPWNHAIVRLARQMETSDAARPFYRGSDHWGAARA